ncbi:hypothetical protein [Clostridium estertheticum]|uniref:hypothetical protein n=1 Tax=Clostridium estertheticum TaxID=238834 RepID=UPI001C0CF6B2|nr:hypothetical protein [Clostridium estertheticum]MBU3173280.1 hypothetical protein [Clostridium estertheticum]
MFKKTAQKLSKILKKGEKTYNTLILTSMIGMGISSNVYASQPVLISGTVKLFSAITTWLLVIIPVGAGAVLGYQALQKSLTDDQGVIGEKNKMMKNVIIGAAIAETASGLITVILGFYK